MLVLPRAVLHTLKAEAAAAAPAECCGLLVGREAAGGRRVDAVQPAPSGTATRYAIPPALFLATERDARARGAFVCGVYHSHPRAPALPSACDGTLAWPGLDYLIVPGDAALPVRAWRLADDRSGFVETSIELAG